MGHIFKGLVFVMLDFYINLGAIRIGFLPDFVGYLLMIRGLEELKEENRRFPATISLAKVMVVYSGVLYAMDLFGISVEHEFLAWVLGVAGMILRLMIIYRIVQGIRDMESGRLWDLQGEKLHSLWLAMAVLSGITQLLSWMPLVGVMSSIAGLIVCICFLVAFHGTKRRHEEQSL